MNYMQFSWDSFLSSFRIKHLTFTISSARLRSIIISNHCQVKTISSFKFYQYSKLRSLCKSWKFRSSLQYTEWVSNLLSTLMAVCTDLFACDLISIVWVYSHIMYVSLCAIKSNTDRSSITNAKTVVILNGSDAMIMVQHELRGGILFGLEAKREIWVNLSNIPCLRAWWWIGI